MRIRLLPVTMFLGGLLLTVKLGALVSGGGPVTAGIQVADSQAQQADAATAPGEGDAPAGEPDSELAGLEPPPALPPLAPPTEFTQAELDVLQNLRERRETLDARETELDLRQSTIEAAEHNVEGRIEDWKRLKAEVEQLLTRYEKAQNDELDTLAAYYEKMKPKDAARVFDTLDLPYLIEIVGRMKAAKVADVIGKMDTLKAKELTIELARQDQDAGAGAGTATP
ncbi:MAG TPA: hypothetical protein VGB88_12065 [Alphaproteobacteria bacterium]